MTWLERVWSHPGEAAALELKGRVMAYGELRERADELAARLRQQGLARGDLVALEARRSPDYVVELLGVWRAGGAVLPLPADWPSGRRRQILGLAAPVRDLSTSGLGPPGAKAETSDGGLAVACPTEALGARPQWPAGEDLAYVVFTSGSSGRPKGVEVEWGAYSRVIAFQSECFGLGPESRSLWILSPGFDASFSDLGTALYAGACLVLDGPGPDLSAQLRHLRISYLDLPPALLGLTDLSPLNTVVSGGEVADPEAVRNWAERVRLINVYGPTEATICTSLVRCGRDWDRPWLGDPLPEVVYRVEQDELWIAGPTLARGYRGQPELTEERFVWDGPVRWYRTGDRVHRHARGLSFAGRVDRQVKVRGRLVCPEEVEACLRAVPGVRAAAVVATRDGLRAFCEGPNEVGSLRAALLAGLPDWMVPRSLELGPLPRNPHGKLDLGVLQARSAWLDTLPLEMAALDSLALLQLAAQAQSLGWPISPGSLAQGELTGGRCWSEAREAAELRALAEPCPQVQWSPGRGSLPPGDRVALVTGAGGFLGSHLVGRLPHPIIYCLVRPGARLPDDPRLRPLEGDLSQSCLGLPEDRYRDLAEQVEEVFHCAGRVSVAAPSDWFLEVNLTGTRRLLEWMGLGVPKRLHYASTLSVLVSSDRGVGRLGEGDDLSAVGAVYGGYAQSKFAAEVLVRNWPGLTCIYRLGLLTGHSQTGRAPRRDLLRLFARGVARLGAVPEGDLENLEVDLTPVDFAAAAIAGIAADPEARGTYHVAQPRGVPLARLVERLEARLGPFRRVDYACLQAPAGDFETAAAILAMCRLFPGALESSRSTDLFAATGVEFELTRTREALTGSGVDWPNLDQALLERYLDEWLSEGGVCGG